MDGIRLKGGLMVRLSDELDRPALQVINGALSSMLRSYEVTKRETGLSINAVSFPELNILTRKMRFENYSASIVNQYRRSLTDLLVYVGKPAQEIAGEGMVERLNYYEQVRQISTSTKDHKRCTVNPFFTSLHDCGYIRKNPMVIVDPAKYVVEVRETLASRKVEESRIVCGGNACDNAVSGLSPATGCRISEVVGVHVEDTDMQVGCVKVLGKGWKERVVFSGGRVMEYLERYLGGRKVGAVMLSSRVSHQGLKRDTLENIIHRIANQAGLGKCVFPYLSRHIFATRALNKGMPLSTPVSYTYLRAYET